MRTHAFVVPALVALALSAGTATTVRAQAHWRAQSSGTTADFRGLSAVSERVAWASGSRGTVARTTDGGATWRADTVPGARALDFRDVEAFDARRAYVLSIGNGSASRIYKTTDGGKTWALQFTNRDTASFFDCLAFWTPEHGIAVSDAVKGRFRIVETRDGGKTWRDLPPASLPEARDGEGAFAASGTCLVARGRRHAWIASTGARVIRTADNGTTWRAAETPLLTGRPGAGVFSVAFRTAEIGVAVGGDYQRPKEGVGTAAFTRDGGATWEQAQSLPWFRSGVAYRAVGTGQHAVAVGTSGTSVSYDDGRNWTTIDTLNLNAVAFARDGAGWAAGPRGTIVKWTNRCGGAPWCETRGKATRVPPR